MKIAIIKPASENLARIELGFSYEDLDVATAFDPSSTKVLTKSGEKETVEFEVSPGSTNALGRYGLTVKVNSEAPTEKIVVQVRVSGIVSPAGTALLTRAQTMLSKVESQVAAVLKAYNDAKTKIEEV